MSDWAATLGLLLRERGADLFGYACLFAASDDLLLLHPVNQIAQNLRSQSPTGYNNPKCSKSWVVGLTAVPR